MTDTTKYAAGRALEPPSTEDGNRCAPDDVALLERIRAGDERACEALVRQHIGRMLAVARRFLRTEEDSADAVLADQRLAGTLVASPDACEQFDVFRGTPVPVFGARGLHRAARRVLAGTLHMQEFRDQPGTPGQRRPATEQVTQQGQAWPVHEGHRREVEAQAVRRAR